VNSITLHLSLTQGNAVAMGKGREKTQKDSIEELIATKKKKAS
jgi:hypothetical protein